MGATTMSPTYTGLTVLAVGVVTFLILLGVQELHRWWGARRTTYVQVNSSSGRRYARVTLAANTTTGEYLPALGEWKVGGEDDEP